MKINASTLLKIAVLVAALLLGRILLDKFFLHVTGTVVRREGPGR
jgi:hypothetical protein